MSQKGQGQQLLPNQLPSLMRQEKSTAVATVSCIICWKRAIPASCIQLTSAVYFSTWRQEHCFCKRYITSARVNLFSLQSRHILKRLEPLEQSSGASLQYTLVTPEQCASLRTTAQQYTLRILGPNSLWFISPWHNPNPSFRLISVRRGKLALVIEAGSVANLVLAWACYPQHVFLVYCAREQCRYSHRLNACLLSRDQQTSAFLLLLEQIPNARSFVSAARSGANKPFF